MDRELVFLVNNLIIPLAGMTTAIIIGASVLKTVRHYIDRKVGRGDGLPAADLAELKGRLEELERSSDRVDELEDRVEFAERLLTKSREGQRVSD